MNYASLVHRFHPISQGQGSVDAGAAKSESILEVKNTTDSEPTGLGEHMAATRTADDLPIGEAVPDGAHVRSLRVFSTGGEARQPCRRERTSDRTLDSPRSVREVQVLQVFKNPDVMIAPNLLTKAQCQHMVQLADGKWSRSKTSIGMSTAPQNEYTTMESKTRTSMSVMLEEAQTPCVASVELLACALARMPLQHLESLVLVRYNEGEYFNEHHDGAFRPQTVLLYLNDVEEGGFTHFTRLGLKIAPAEGCGAVWSNVTPQGTMDYRMLHAGAPPSKGIKYVVNCFFNESVVRFAQPPLPLAAAEKPEGATSAASSSAHVHPADDATKKPSQERAPLQEQKCGGQQMQMQPPAIFPSPQVWPLYCPGPNSKAAFHQPTWGQAMLPVLQQLRHQELGNLFCPPMLAGAPKFVSPRGGAPSVIPYTSDAWRAHATAALPPGRRWLHSWPPKSS